MNDRITSGDRLIMLFFASILALLGGLGSTVFLSGIQAGIAALIMVFIIALTTYFSVQHIIENH